MDPFKSSLAPERTGLLFPVSDTAKELIKQVIARRVANPNAPPVTVDQVKQAVQQQVPQYESRPDLRIRGGVAPDQQTRQYAAPVDLSQLSGSVSPQTVSDPRQRHAMGLAPVYNGIEYPNWDKYNADQKEELWRVFAEQTNTDLTPPPTQGEVLRTSNRGVGATTGTSAYFRPTEVGQLLPRWSGSYDDFRALPPEIQQFYATPGHETATEADLTTAQNYMDRVTALRPAGTAGNISGPGGTTRVYQPGDVLPEVALDANGKPLEYGSDFTIAGQQVYAAPPPNWGGTETEWYALPEKNRAGLWKQYNEETSGSGFHAVTENLSRAYHGTGLSSVMSLLDKPASEVRGSTGSAAYYMATHNGDRPPDELGDGASWMGSLTNVIGRGGEGVQWIYQQLGGDQKNADNALIGLSMLNYLDYHPEAYDDVKKVHDDAIANGASEEEANQAVWDWFYQQQGFVGSLVAGVIWDPLNWVPLVGAAGKAKILRGMEDASDARAALLAGDASAAGKLNNAETNIAIGRLLSGPQDAIDATVEAVMERGLKRLIPAPLRAPAEETIRATKAENAAEAADIARQKGFQETTLGTRRAEAAAEDVPRIRREQAQAEWDRRWNAYQQQQEKEANAEIQRQIKEGNKRRAAEGQAQKQADAARARRAQAEEAAAQKELDRQIAESNRRIEAQRRDAEARRAKSEQAAADAKRAAEAETARLTDARQTYDDLYADHIERRQNIMDDVTNPTARERQLRNADQAFERAVRTKLQRGRFKLTDEEVAAFRQGEDVATVADRSIADLPETRASAAADTAAISSEDALDTLTATAQNQLDQAQDVATDTARVARTDVPEADSTLAEAQGQVADQPVRAASVPPPNGVRTTLPDGTIANYFEPRWKTMPNGVKEPNLAALVQDVYGPRNPEAAAAFWPEFERLSIRQYQNDAALRQAEVARGMSDRATETVYRTIKRVEYNQEVDALFETFFGTPPPRSVYRMHDLPDGGMNLTNGKSLIEHAAYGTNRADSMAARKAIREFRYTLTRDQFGNPRSNEDLARWAGAVYDERNPPDPWEQIVSEVFPEATPALPAGEVVDNTAEVEQVLAGVVPVEDATATVSDIQLRAETSFHNPDDGVAYARIMGEAVNTPSWEAQMTWPDHHFVFGYALDRTSIPNLMEHALWGEPDGIALRDGKWVREEIGSATEARNALYDMQTPGRVSMGHPIKKGAVESIKKERVRIFGKGGESLSPSKIGGPRWQQWLSRYGRKLEGVGETDARLPKEVQVRKNVMRDEPLRVQPTRDGGYTIVGQDRYGRPFQREYPTEQEAKYVAGALERGDFPEEAIPGNLRVSAARDQVNALRPHPELSDEALRKGIATFDEHGLLYGFDDEYFPGNQLVYEQDIRTYLQDPNPRGIPLTFEQAGDALTGYLPKKAGDVSSAELTADLFDTITDYVTDADVKAFVKAKFGSVARKRSPGAMGIVYRPEDQVADLKDALHSTASRIHWTDAASPEVGRVWGETQFDRLYNQGRLSGLDREVMNEPHTIRVKKGGSEVDYETTFAKRLDENYQEIAAKAQKKLKVPTSRMSDDEIVDIVQSWKDADQQAWEDAFTATQREFEDAYARSGKRAPKRVTAAIGKAYRAHQNWWRQTSQFNIYTGIPKYGQDTLSNLWVGIQHGEAGALKHWNTIQYELLRGGMDNPVAIEDRLPDLFHALNKTGRRLPTEFRSEALAARTQGQVGQQLYASRLNEWFGRKIPFGEKLHVPQLLGGASENIRDLRQAGDLAIRQAVFENAYEGELIGARYRFTKYLQENGTRMGMDQSVFEDLRALGPEYSPEDIRSVMKAHGISDDTAARTWSKELDDAWSASLKKVHKLYFDYKKTTADEKLGYVFMFHYWMTRNAWQQAKWMASHPGFAMAYLKTWEASKQLVSDVAPQWMKDWISFGDDQGLYGLVDVWNLPLAFLSMYKLSNPGQFNATLFDKAVEDSGLFFSPTLQAAFTAIGYSTKIGDPTGTLAGRRAIIRAYDWWRNNTESGRKGIGPFGKRGITKDWVDQTWRDVVNASSHFTSKHLPWSKSIEKNSYLGDQWHQLRMSIVDDFVSQYGPVESWNADTVALWHDVEMDLETNNFDNPWIANALERRARVNLTDVLAKGVSPTPISIRWGPLDESYQKESEAFGNWDAGNKAAAQTLAGQMGNPPAYTPSTADQNQMDEAAMARGADPQARIFHNGIEGWYSLGNAQTRLYRSIVNQITHPEDLDPSFVMSVGGETYTVADVSAMSFKDRKALAEEYIDEKYGKNGVTPPSEQLNESDIERDAYRGSHPEVGDFLDYQSWLLADPAKARQVRTELERAPGDTEIKRQIAKKRQTYQDQGLSYEEVEAKLDQWMATDVAYMALLGYRYGGDTDPGDPSYPAGQYPWRVVKASQETKPSTQTITSDQLPKGALKKQIYPPKHVYTPKETYHQVFPGESGTPSMLDKYLFE